MDHKVLILCGKALLNDEPFENGEIVQSYHDHHIMRYDDVYFVVRKVVESRLFGFKQETTIRLIDLGDKQYYTTNKKFAVSCFLNI